MNRQLPCDVFQDQLDALLEKRLPEAGVEQMQDHAASCPDCAMQLQMHEHLMTHALSDLEAAVTPELLESVWPRVRTDITAGEPARRRGLVHWHGWNRLVPVLAAATLLLCVGVALLYWEVLQLHERETVLVRQIAEQDRRLAQLVTGSSMDPATRTARLAGKAAWERALERRNSMTISELETLLHTVPAHVTMLDADASEALARSIPFWAATAAEAAISQVDVDDGLQAGELLQVMAALDLNPERRIATARILELSRGVARQGRS